MVLSFVNKIVKQQITGQYYIILHSDHLYVEIKRQQKYMVV